MIMSTFKPDEEKEQGWYVDGEDATQQRSAKSHRKHQLGSVQCGTEKDFVDRILGQLGLVALIFNSFWIESYTISIVPWHVHPHVARLKVERIPFQVINAPPEISVVFLPFYLVL